MLIEEVGKLSPLQRFLYWIRERHQIYLRRKLGHSKPWTNDTVLQSYFFTNPYRENDKITVWFRENIRDPLKDMRAVIFAIVAFRWFNWIPTGQTLIGDSENRGPLENEDLFLIWNLNEAKRRLRLLDRVFTGAFNISNSGSKKPKIDRVCDDYIQPVWERDREIREVSKRWNTMQSAHSYLRQFPGLGGSGFMAYEIVCDLRYTGVLDHATDKSIWSNPGPGAKRGINRLLDRPLTAPVKDWPYQSVKLLENAKSALRMPLEMREIEHSLCEWDKYERARLNDGHMKRTYNGRA
jgi:hypothetical protein